MNKLSRQIGSRHAHAEIGERRFEKGLGLGEPAARPVRVAKVRVPASLAERVEGRRRNSLSGSTTFARELREIQHRSDLCARREMVERRQDITGAFLHAAAHQQVRRHEDRIFAGDVVRRSIRQAARVGIRLCERRVGTRC